MKSFFFLPCEKAKYSEFKSKATIVQQRPFSHAKVVIVRCCSIASGAQCFTLSSTKPVKMYTTDTHANIASRTHKGGKLSRILVCCYRPVTKAFNTYSCYSTLN